MVGKDLDFSGLNDTGDGIMKMIKRASDNFLREGELPRELTVHPRANEAKEDYLRDVPGELYRIMKDDIARVWGLLESPIEQVAMFQLAAENYGREDWPIYPKVARERGKFSHKNYPVQIIPQVAFGRFRVDFLFDLGARGLFAVECDGAEFHQDAKKDQIRDRYLFDEHRVTVLRLTGKQLWRDNTAAGALADLIRVYLK